MGSGVFESAESEAFNALFESLPNPLCCYDKSEKILRCNQAFAACFDLEAEAVIGKDFFKALSPETVATRLKEVIRAVFRGKQMNDIQCKLQLFSGESRHFSLSTFPIVDTAHQFPFGVAMVIDVTRKKELEQALVQTEKMAALGTLAAGLAHEVGTPMNVILGRAESLLKSTKEIKTAKGLTIITEQIDRMTHLIERLLAFARKKPIARKQINLNPIIQKGIELLGQRAHKNGIAFVIDLDPQLPTIWGDGEQILQVLLNLMMNALDAISSDGVIKIQSFLSGKNTKSEAVEFILEDTGDGIEAAHLHKVFEPFFTTKPVGKGTGLGLAVVHGIIREHSGQIIVCSEIGKGTSFSVRLPLGSSPRASSKESFTPPD